MQDIELFKRVIKIVQSQPNDGTALRLAERLLDSLLREVQYLWELFFAFSHRANPDEEAAMWASFERWANVAGEAIEQARQVQRSAVFGLQELDHQHGRVMAMLSITLEGMREGREQARSGRTYTVEELRSELRLKRERAGASDVGDVGIRPPRAGV